MKRYLWTAVAVLFVNANASENPFELKENLTQINNEEDALLSELSALAEAREDAELEDDDMDAELEKEANAKEAPKKKKAEGKVPVVVDAALDAEDAEMDAELAAEAKKHGLPLGEPEKEANAKEQDDVANAIDALVGDTAEEAPVIADQAAKDAEKAAQAKADQEKAAQAKAQKEADTREEERREVAAYEKQRAEKLAKQAEQKSETAYSVKMWKAEQETVKKTVADTPVVKEVITEEIEIVDEKSVETTTLADGDIDVKAEKRAAKEAADTAYLEAVREMDQED